MTRYSDPDLLLTDTAVDDHVAAGSPPAAGSDEASVANPTKGFNHV